MLDESKGDELDSGSKTGHCSPSESSQRPLARPCKVRLFSYLLQPIGRFGQVSRHRLLIFRSMTLFGMRKYPTPVNKPMMPFYVGGVVMLLAINSLAGAMMDTAEFRNDPRNPRGMT